MAFVACAAYQNPSLEQSTDKRSGARTQRLPRDMSVMPMMAPTVECVVETGISKYLGRAPVAIDFPTSATRLLR